MNLFSSSKIDSEVLLRAVAISAVVFNHAHVYGQPGLTYAGGMTVMMLLSGYSFARFAIAPASASHLRSATMTLARLALIPSALIMLASFAFKGRFSLPEALFVGNWFSSSYVSVMPIWYIQVLLQMLAGLYILFHLAHFTDRLFSDPFKFSLLLFLIALSVRLIFPLFEPAEALSFRLPHLLLWNFVLGWVLFFGSRASPNGGRPHRIGLFLCAAAAGLIGWPLSSPQPAWLMLGAALLIWIPRLSLPSGLGRALTIISQASFAVFLLHSIGLGAYRAVIKLPSPTLAFAAAMILSVGVWIIGTSFTRAYRQLHRTG